MRMSEVSEETRKIVDELKLNPKLLAENDVPEKNIKKMKKQYDKLRNIFLDAQELNDLYDMGEISSFLYKKDATKLGKDLEKVEMKLQKLWNFPQDDNFYTYWNLLPGCKCPQLDNKERYRNSRIINCECPYHNFLVECKNKK